MSQDLIVQIFREVLKTTLILMAPALMVSIVVGLLVSIFQAATQIPIHKSLPDRQVGIGREAPYDGPVCQANGNRWATGTKLVTASVWRGDGQRTISNDRAQLHAEQEHTCAHPTILVRNVCRLARREANVGG